MPKLIEILNYLEPPKITCKNWPYYMEKRVDLNMEI